MNSILSLNIKGLEVLPKFLTLKDLFLSSHSNIILIIQKSMHSTSQIVDYFQRMFLTWYIVATDATSRSGGLAAFWDPRRENLKAFTYLVGIFLVGSIKGIPGRMHILNVYAPYKEQECFSDIVEAYGILHSSSLIFAGDLNCTIGIEEIWG